MDARQGTGAAGRGQAAAKKAAGRGRVAASPYLNDMLEYLRWVNVMVRDHDLLRQLLARLERAASPRERAYLLGVALEFHRMHQEFEAVWMRLPELEPRRDALDALAVQLEAEPAGRHARLVGPAARMVRRGGDADALRGTVLRPPGGQRPAARRLVQRGAGGAGRLHRRGQRRPGDAADARPRLRPASRQITAPAAHRVMREMGVRFNDLGTFRRANRRAGG